MGWSEAMDFRITNGGSWSARRKTATLGEGIWDLGADAHDFQYLVRAGGRALLTASYVDARQFYALNRRKNSI